MPKTDTLNARIRGSSHIDFKTATTGVAAKAMRNEISRIVSTVEDPATKKVRVCLRFSAMSTLNGYRHSTLKCKAFSTSLRVICPTEQRAKICELSNFSFLFTLLTVFQ